MGDGPLSETEQTEPQTEANRKRDERGWFQRGTAPGPGRPPGQSLKGLVQAEFGGWIVEQIGDHQTRFRVFMDTLWQAVQDGKPWAMEFVGDRILSGDILDQIEAYENRKRHEDEDFIHYRIWRKSSEIQRQILLSTAPQILEMAGRQAGKTQGHIRLLADTMVRGATECLYLGLTAEKARQQIWKDLLALLKWLGIEITKQDRTNGMIEAAGSICFIDGNNDAKNRDKFRGPARDLVIVDECQSQQGLDYLIESVIEESLMSKAGRLAMSGTAPKIPGTFWEWSWLGSKPDGKPMYPQALRLNWNIGQNPFVKDYQKVLAKVREDKGLTENDALYQREYLGKIMYDVDAMCFRLTPANHFQEADLVAWIQGQPAADLFLSGGIDYGFDDFNSCVIILGSESKGERFLLSEYKGHRQSTSDFGNEIKRCMAGVLSNPLLAKLPNKRLTFFCDTEGLGKQLTHDLASMYGIPVQPAYQGQGDLMVEMLQDDIRAGRFKVHEVQTVGGVKVTSEFEQESYKIVFARDEQDHLTRRIDDDVFHPDLAMSVLYGMRYVWLKSRVKPGGSK